MSDNVNNHLAERLMGSYTVTESGCWEWNKSRQVRRGGYGQLRVGGKTLRASRAAYEAWVGPCVGRWVLHKCDNPPCINPDHLFLGDAVDNSHDMWDKGRGVNPVLNGEDAPASKLSSDDVGEIRRLISVGHNGAEIGRRFGVTRQTIYLIRKGKTWRQT